MKRLVILGFFAGSIAFAEGDPFYLRKLVRATSTHEVERILQDFRDTTTRLEVESEWREVCLSQLRGIRIPITCARTIQRETRSRLHAREIEWLAKICVDRASKSRDRRELDEAFRTVGLPADCKKAIADRIADLEYAAEKEAPAELFGWLLDPEIRSKPEKVDDSSKRSASRSRHLQN